MKNQHLDSGLGAGKLRIVVVASLTSSLTNFRLELLKRMAEAGHEITAIGPEDDQDVLRTLDDIGVRFEKIPMARTGLNPFEDLRTLSTLWRVFMRLKPDIVLPYTMKPIIYGGIAARLAGVRRRCALVTGLGHVFSDTQSGWRNRLIRLTSVWLYRRALGGAEIVFTYNEADEADIKNHRMITSDQRMVRVPGSGVDLEHYQFSEPPVEPPTFILIARLLRDKGIVEFAEAAKLVRQRYGRGRFQLLGPFDPNPTAISHDEIETWKREGALDYLGETREVRPYLARCSALVLPTYYREGIPRTILEAMATGRAVVTTNTPGCRDTVIDGVNGYLVEPRQVEMLADRMGRLIENPSLFKEMGKQSHRLAQDRFDVHNVNRILLSEINLMPAVRQDSRAQA